MTLKYFPLTSSSNNGNNASHISFSTSGTSLSPESSDEKDLNDPAHIMLEYTTTVLERFKAEAITNLSPELVWKFYLELATIYERAQAVDAARKALALSVRHVPNSQQLWKVWLHGARIELNAGHLRTARRLLFQAMKLVPAKAQHTVLLEYARFEEFLGNIDKARYILQKAKKETKYEWKVCFYFCFTFCTFRTFFHFVKHCI